MAALKRRWRARGGTGTPNIVMGGNVQVCWDKFANYFEVEARLVPMQGARFHLDAASALPHVDENTIGVVAVLGSGHKYGLVYPGVGWVVWRDVPALPEELIYRVNYLGDEMATFALNFSRPGAQLPVFAAALGEDVTGI